MQTANETPFPYQVAGHGALLKLPEGKICKPLIERELSFYESLKKSPSTLKPFTATYHGTIELSITKDTLNQWNAKVEEAEKDENGKGSFEDEHLLPWSAHVTKLSLSKLETNNGNSFSILIFYYPPFFS